MAAVRDALDGPQSLIALPSTRHSMGSIGGVGKTSVDRRRAAIGAALAAIDAYEGAEELPSTGAAVEIPAGISPELAAILAAFPTSKRQSDNKVMLSLLNTFLATADRQLPGGWRCTTSPNASHSSPSPPSTPTRPPTWAFSPILDGLVALHVVILLVFLGRDIGLLASVVRFLHGWGVYVMTALLTAVLWHLRSNNPTTPSTSKQQRPSSANARESTPTRPTPSTLPSSAPRVPLTTRSHTPKPAPVAREAPTATPEDGLQTTLGYLGGCSTGNVWDTPLAKTCVGLVSDLLQGAPRVEDGWERSIAKRDFELFGRQPEDGLPWFLAQFNLNTTRSVSEVLAMLQSPDLAVRQASDPSSLAFDVLHTDVSDPSCQDGVVSARIAYSLFSGMRMFGVASRDFVIHDFHLKPREAAEQLGLVEFEIMLNKSVEVGHPLSGEREGIVRGAIEFSFIAVFRRTAPPPGRRGEMTFLMMNAGVDPGGALPAWLVAKTAGLKMEERYKKIRETMS